MLPISSRPKRAALPRVASGRCKVAAVGMRLDARTKGAEVLEAWARALKLPFIGVLREAQAYVRCVEQGLTVFDLPDAQAQVDVAQWKPIVAWLEPVLRAVHKPVLRGNASVARPSLPPLVLREGDRIVTPALVDADVAVLAADPRLAPARALPAAQAANGPVPAEHARLASAAAPPAAAPRLGSLFSWLTSPRFLHRNS
jgi:chromosome partitioning protein